MKTSTVLGLAGLGALAWYLTRQRGGTTAPGPFGPTRPAPDDETVAGTAWIGRYDWFLSQGGKSDKCDLPGGNYDGDRHTAWSEEQKRCASEYHAGRAQSFYEQVWEPASRVPITSLTPADFKLAVLFLANKLDRRGVPWTYGQSKSVNDFNDTIGGIGTFAEIAGPILNAFTLGLWNKAEGLAIDAAKENNQDVAGAVGDASTLSEAIRNMEAGYQAAVTALPQYTGGGENALVVKEAAFVGDATFGSADPLVHQYSKAWDAVFIDPWGPSMDFGYEPIEFPWGNLYFMCQLFAPDPGGHGTWKYPWISVQTGYPTDGGDGSTLTDKTAKAAIIAKQARLFRTLATLGAMLKPDVVSYVYGAEPDAEGNINVSDLEVQKRVRPGLYAYKVGTVELWGCVLPAAREDNATDLTQIVGKRLAGSTYDRSVTQTTTQAAESTYAGTQAPIPTPTQVAQSTVPTANKAAAPLQQTAQSGYNLPSSDAGAATTSPTVAGLGRHAARII